MSKRFNIPFVADIPVEVESKLNEQVARDISYVQMKNQETLKKYMDESSNTRLVANYIRDFFNNNPIGELSYEEIANNTGLTEAQVRLIVSELARWDNYPYVIVSTPKKKGYFQLHSKNIEDTEKWITTQSRQIASREQRLDRTVRATDARRKKVRKRKAVPVQQENVTEN